MGNRQAAPQKIVEEYQRMHLGYLEHQESIELGRKSHLLVEAKEIPIEEYYEYYNNGVLTELIE